MPTSSVTTATGTTKDTNLAEPTENYTALRVMSFNVRTGERTETRMSAVIKNITDVDPDVLGVQEAADAWVTYLNTNLPAYSRVGLGRDEGDTGETTSIFYKTSKYNLIQSGTKWLSLTPDTPSILEGGSKYKRIVTYVKLQDKTTGMYFVCMNAHLDYSSDDIARQQMNIVAEFAANFAGLPVYIIGDMNQNETSKTYGYITTNGYADSAEIATVSKNSVTFQNYGKDDPADPACRIDFCFVTPEHIFVSKYDVWDKQAENGGYNGYISDHYAIYVDTKFVNSGHCAGTNPLNQTVFQCGDRIYGDVSFNQHGIDSATCSFSGNIITLNLKADKTLTLGGLKTAAGQGVQVKGSGTLVVDGFITTDTLKVSDTAIMNVSGAGATVAAILANKVEYDENTTVNINVTQVDAMCIAGNVTAYGYLNISNSTGDKTGIKFTAGENCYLYLNENSRVRITNFTYGFGNWTDYGTTIELPSTVDVSGVTGDGKEVCITAPQGGNILYMANIATKCWKFPVVLG